MIKWIKIASSVLSICLFFVSQSSAMDIVPGDYVQLKATNPAGVPLHREAKSSMFSRLPDQTIVSVLQTTNTNWLRVGSGELTGWIVKKYVEKVVQVPTGGDPGISEGDQTSAIWQSADLCMSSVNAGARLSRNADETIRLATWNIRWFPQGTLDGDNQEKVTDLAWLSCALAWVDADIIAVQEILDHAEARQAMENVLDGLQGFNGGDWKIDLQECGSENAQHVGFIYNAERVELSGIKDMWEFNGRASSSADSPCEGNLRPGRYAYVKSKSPNGFDFHLVVVHTDSGVGQGDYDNRNIVLDRIDSVAATLLSTDADIVIIGDFNTMGTSTKPASVELSEFSAKVGNESPGFIDVPVEPQCTEYYSGSGGWLDHTVVTAATRELAVQQAVVHGYCNMANCDRLSDMPNAYDALSDHCPVVIDFINTDID